MYLVGKSGKRILSRRRVIRDFYRLQGFAAVMPWVVAILKSRVRHGNFTSLSPLFLHNSQPFIYCMLA